MKINKFVFSPISVNTYVLDNDNGECVVIDCGCYDEAEFAILMGYLDKNNLRPVLLLNTHCHLDHIFGNSMFFDRYGLKTKACKNEEENLRNSTVHAKMYGLAMDTPPDIGEYVEEGQIIKFGSLEMEAIYVPGHTAGSIAWYIESEKVVFTGDALFARGIGRTDLPGGNYEQLIDNIRTKLLTLPPDTIIYPGHGDSSTIENEISTNPWLS